MLPKRYLDFEAMQRHDFIIDMTQGYDYNLTFDKYRTVSVMLPVPALFDFQNKQRYFIYENETHVYNTVVEAARLAEQATRNASTSYHFDYYPD